MFNESLTQALRAGITSSDNPADSQLVRFRDDTHIGGEPGLVVNPQMLSLTIQCVNLGVGTLLFNNEHFNSKLKNLIEALERQFIKRRRFDFAHNAATKAEKPARTMAAETRTAVQWTTGRRCRNGRKSPLGLWVRRFIWRRVSERLRSPFNLLPERVVTIFSALWPPSVPRRGGASLASRVALNNRSEPQELPFQAAILVQ